MTRLPIVQAHTTNSISLRTLDIRVDAPNRDAEQPQAASTGGTSILPWPLVPEIVIDYWMGNPYLAAVGKLLADSIASGEWDLRPREFDLDGKPIDTKKDKARLEADYARGMAWFAREDLALDGVTVLDLEALLKTMTLHLDQVGNVFLEVLRDRGGREPLRLSVLLPQFLNYEVTKEDGVRLVQLDPFRGYTKFVPFKTREAGDTEVREFLHQRLPNTVSSFYGVPSWIEARASVDVDNAHRKYLTAFFSNHASPRWMIEISMDPEWQAAGGTIPDEVHAAAVFDHVVNYLNANRGDMAGRNLILYFPGGIRVKATPLDVKVEDPTFGQTAKNARDEILAVRHVSLIDLGLPEGGYRATASTQASGFRRQVLEPFAQPALALLNRVLHAPAPYGLGIGTHDLALDFQRVEETLAQFEALVKATGGTAIISPDEARQVVGYEAKGVDELYLTASLVPAGPVEPGGPDSGPDRDPDRAAATDTTDDAMPDMRQG
jgi:phage portal protein BeeE